VDAYRKLGINATSAQLREYISGIKSYPGINGSYDFDAVPQRGLSVQNAIVTRWDASKGAWETMSQPTGIPLNK